MRLGGVLLAFLLAWSGAPVSGQEPDRADRERDAAVRRLSVGQPVRLLVAGGAQLEGTLTRLDATTLEVAPRDGPRTVPVADIQRLWVRGRSSGSGSAVGALLGAGAGAFLGDLSRQLACDCGDATPWGERGTGIAVGALVGGGIGFLAGRLIGSGIPTWRVVFP